MRDDNYTWLSIEEAAARTGYHPNHLRRLARSGDIVARKFAGVWIVALEPLLIYKADRHSAWDEKTTTD
jgi:hypothetical protein